MNNRRQFLKSVFGVMAGLAVVPSVVKAKYYTIIRDPKGKVVVGPTPLTDTEVKLHERLKRRQEAMNEARSVWLVQWGETEEFSITPKEPSPADEMLNRHRKRMDAEIKRTMPFI